MTGKQGHVAYPQRADNPIRGLVTLVAALQAEPLDQGSAQFAPSHLEFTSVDVGNKTVNLIPGEARARFNIRFNDKHTLDSLKKLIEQRAAKAAGGKIKFAFQWEPSNAGVFVTKPGPFTELVANAVAEVTGRKPELSTTGGTSDARFITAYCPVVEFGLVGPDDASGRRARADRRSARADDDLSQDYRSVFRVVGLSSAGTTAESQ